MSNLLAGGTARAYELATRKETPMQAHPKRLLAIVFTLALVGGASPVWSASPTMSTFPGSGACGIPGFDLCEPVVDVFVNFPTAPPIPIPGPSFGLVPGDVITSFSWGLDLLGGPGDSIHFSVAAGSLGALLTGVAAEAGTADQAGDIYFGGTIGVPAANVLAVDGNGLPAAAPPASGLPEPGDELSALASCDALTGPLLAGGFAFFTLAPGSPSLGSIPCPTCTPADILVAPSGGPPLLAVAGGALGLVPGDVIDALAFDGGPGILFSLAPGSPSLTGPPFPSDILGGGPVIAVAGAAIGLLPGDDLDALDIAPDGDADLVNDACDNCPGLANNGQGDADLDLAGDACDTCTDTDGDGLGNPGFPANTCGADPCPADPNNTCGPSVPTVPSPGLFLLAGLLLVLGSALAAAKVRA